MFQIAALLFFPKTQPGANFHHYFRVLAAIVFCSVPATSLTFWMWVKRARSQLLQSEGTEAMSSLNQMWYRSIRGSASQGWSCWHTKRTLEQLWTPRSLRELCKTSQIHSFTWDGYLYSLQLDSCLTIPTEGLHEQEIKKEQPLARGAQFLILGNQRINIKNISRSTLWAAYQVQY